MTIALTVSLDAVRRTHGSGFELGPLTFDLRREVVCLVGANGAGKSTLFRLLAGVDRPTGGVVTFPGQRTNARTPHLGYLPQEMTFPGYARVSDYLTYVAWVYAIPRSERAARVSAALRTVDLLGKADTPVRTLSGGMRRRLGVAQAIVHQPDVLLLDEPTVGLDPLQRIALRQTVREAAQGRTVVVSTHLVDDVAELADRVIVLAEGTVTYDGTVGRLEQLGAAATGPGGSLLERAIAAHMGAPTGDAPVAS